MKYLGVVTLEKVLKAVRAGQPVDEKTLYYAERAVQREKDILEKRAARSEAFFQDRAEMANIREAG